MLYKFLTLLAAGKPEQDGGKSRLLQFLPLIILVVMSALSSWLKGRSKQKEQSPTRPSQSQEPQEQQKRRGRQLPVYARQRQTSSTTQPEQPSLIEASKSAARKTHPAATSQRPTQQPSKPIPYSRQETQPLSISSHRSAPMPSRPAPVSQDRQRRVVAPVSRSVGLPQQPIKPGIHTAAAAMPRRSVVKKQRLSARQAARLRQTIHKEKEKAAPEENFTNRLHLALRNRDDVAQAIVLAEILGQPLAMRSGACFESLHGLPNS